MKTRIFFILVAGMAVLLSGGKAWAQATDTWFTKGNEILECNAAAVSGEDGGNSKWRYLGVLMSNYDEAAKDYMARYMVTMMHNPEQAAARRQQCDAQNPASFVNIIPARGIFSEEPYTRLSECYGAMFQYAHNEGKPREAVEAYENMQYALTTMREAGADARGKDNSASFMVKVGFGQITQEDMIYCLEMSTKLIR